MEAVDDPLHGPNRPLVNGGAAAKGPLPYRGLHILIVEDERLTRTVLSSLLRKCGYRVTSACDGAEALRLLRSSASDTFQLVLTDVCMPELNGIQLLSCLKQDANLRSVPVIMMSSVDQEETVAECVQQGAEEYLIKPVTKKEVQHIWQHVWRKRCAAAPVPQLPLEAAAAAAAAAAASAPDARQTAFAAHGAQQPTSAQAEAQHAAQDVQQPAAACPHQAAQAAAAVGVESVEALIRAPPQASGSRSLHQRQAVFTAAVGLVRAAHLQRRPLLCLRPSRLRFSPAHGLSLAPEQAGGGEADALYASPEEAAGQACPASDLFSLGLLAVDLFFPCDSPTARAAQLRAAHAAVLPAVLSGTHSAGSMAAVQDLLAGLLQADPARRPSVHAVLRAGILDDVYRLVAQLPHWRLLGAAAAAQRPDTPASGHPAAAAAAAPAPARSAPASQRPVDHAAVRHFLLLLRKSKQQERAAAAAQLAALDADIAAVGERRSQDASASWAAPQCEGQEGPEGGPPPTKRARLQEPAGSGEEGEAPPAEPPPEQRRRLEAVMPQLEGLFFGRRSAAGAEAGAHLEPFARDLEELACRSRLGLRATLRSGDLASSVEMACCAAFDRDDEFFATVGVSRRVKIFDFGACLEGGDAVMHYPALQITTRSKLSSVAWSAYVKSQLISSDYGGLIQLWDASTAGEAAQYDEHARRVWSVDFSQTDPMRFLSGSDDGSVRLWSVHEASSVQRIAAPANVCSVQFSPTDSHTIAYGCANYRVYLHDLRMPAQPLAVISGPQRAVSYVKFLGGDHLVSASTDSTLRLWNLRQVVAAGGDVTSASSGSSRASGPRVAPACTFTGHRNQRNFVGLSVSPDGHILCGSEDNSVYTYYRSLPFSTAQYRFPAADAPEGHQPFVSAVCWANRSLHCLAANSQGLLQILKLE